MKKVIVSILCVASLAISTACSSAENSAPATTVSSKPSSSQSDSIDSSAKEDTSSDNSMPIKVEQSQSDVSITLPASMLQGNLADQSIEEAEAMGVKVTKNNDGSVTYQMSKATHQKMMNEVKENMTESFSKLKSGTDFSSIKDISCNDDFSQIVVTVDQDQYKNSMDSLAAIGIGMGCMYYQLFDGKATDSMEVKIDFVDAETGTVFDSVTYPDALNDSTSSK